MKLLVLFALVALAAAAPRDAVAVHSFFNLDGSDAAVANNNSLVNTLVRQLFNLIRSIINNGAPHLGVPVLDPLHLKEYYLSLPTGLINLELDLKNIHATGFGGFEVYKSDLNLRTLTFDIDIGFPSIFAEAEHYDLVGDVFTAIPLYGRGGAVFKADGFRFRALLFLKQSDDGKSVLIDKIENVGFDLPHFESKVTGAVGGGDVDPIVNAMIEEVIIDYVNRFHGAVSKTTANFVLQFLNPLLDGLDTWRFLAPLIPRE